MQVKKVAIIGGGPSGLAAAKSMLEEGLQPVVFEQSSNIGGQWHQEAAHSGVWKNMHTNSSNITTVFSDFPHKENIQMFPTYDEILNYLENYAAHFKLNDCIRLNARVSMISQTTDGAYKIKYSIADDELKEEIFSHVIVASGRFNKPRLPQIKGIENFKGTVLHSFNYKGSDTYKGKKVLVLGNSISGLEIASDLAEEDETMVISACRKPRYIMRKVQGGKPTDCIIFTRFANYAGQALPPEVVAKQMKENILKRNGNPADYGGLKPSENIMEAGISMCENYLDHVSEGKILPKKGVKEFTGKGVIFDDGTYAEIDAVIFATGYNLNLSFLSKEILNTINADDDYIDLYQFTFHPGLPNFAFIGMFAQIGPYFPTVELQSRWIAACWSGVLALPSASQMTTGIEAFSKFKKIRPVLYHDTAIMFSIEAGVEPKLDNHNDIAKALLFGPLAPSQFRLDGHGKKKMAKEIFIAANAKSRK